MTVHPCSSLVSSGDRFTTGLAKVNTLPRNVEGVAKTSENWPFQKAFV